MFVFDCINFKALVTVSCKISLRKLYHILFYVLFKGVFSLKLVIKHCLCQRDNSSVLHWHLVYLLLSASEYLFKDWMHIYFVIIHYINFTHFQADWCLSRLLEAAQLQPIRLEPQSVRS